MKSLIIIEHEPLTVHLKTIWNIDALKERGVHVEYWDLSKLIFPDVDIPMQVDDSCLKHIDKLEEVEKNLKNIDVSNCVFAAEFSLNWNNRKIIYLLHKYQCYCVKFDLYANTALPLSFWEDVEYKLKMITLDKIVNEVVERTRLYYFLKVNTICRFYKKFLSSASHMNPDILINHPDYELYNQITFSSCMKQSYILFVDAYYPLHPDIKRFSDKTVSVEQYRTLMNKFFDFLENKFKKQVVIAAHPKAKYAGTEFNGRKIFWGKTVELIKYSDLVFMHFSNSMSFMALANKPFVFVYPNSFKQYPYIYKSVLKWGKYCQKEVYNLDVCDWNTIRIEEWDNKLREKYIYSFLTSITTCEKKNVDIWVENLLA